MGATTAVSNMDPSPGPALNGGFVSGGRSTGCDAVLAQHKRREATHQVPWAGCRPLAASARGWTARPLLADGGASKLGDCCQQCSFCSATRRLAAGGGGGAAVAARGEVVRGAPWTARNTLSGANRVAGDCFGSRTNTGRLPGRARGGATRVQRGETRVVPRQMNVRMWMRCWRRKRGLLLPLVAGGSLLVTSA